MFWLTFSKTKPKKVEVVNPGTIKPLSCQNYLPSPAFEQNEHLRPIPVNTDVATLLSTKPRTPSPTPVIQVISPRKRSRSPGTNCSSNLNHGTSAVCVPPRAQSRSHSLSGEVPIEGRTLLNLGGPVSIERRTRYVEGPASQRRVEYVQIRKPSRSRSQAKQVEWVETRRSASLGRTQGRSRGRSIVRDRIIEVVEEKERPLSPAHISLLEDEDRNIFNPYEHDIEDYYSPLPRERSCQEIIIEKSPHSAPTSRVRNRSFSRRRPSSTISSSISRSPSTSQKTTKLDSETSSVSSTTTISRTSSSSSSTDPKPRSALSKLKSQYKTVPGGKSALRTFERVKPFRGSVPAKYDKAGSAAKG